jgi:hypothetical protein
MGQAAQRSDARAPRVRAASRDVRKKHASADISDRVPMYRHRFGPSLCRNSNTRWSLNASGIELRLSRG